MYLNVKPSRSLCSFFRPDPPSSTGTWRGRIKPIGLTLRLENLKARPGRCRGGSPFVTPSVRAVNRGARSSHSPSRRVVPSHNMALMNGERQREKAGRAWCEGA